MLKNDNLKNQGFHTNPERINKSGRTVGTKNRATTTRMIFDMVGVLPDKVFNALKEIAPSLEKTMSMEQIIDTMQAYKAATQLDTPAAKYLKDNVYGAPKQDIDVAGKTTISIEIK